MNNQNCLKNILPSMMADFILKECGLETSAQKIKKRDIIPELKGVDVKIKRNKVEFEGHSLSAYMTMVKFKKNE
ncbi:MAG: hypothetical protein PHP83_00080 [Clostridia bacterium]|nr:hypothetical protein [Clostridia bacterium]